MTMKPDDAMSLAERIEGIATESGLASWTVKDLRAIADELREIAEIFRTEARLNYYAQVEDKTFNAWADRLAGDSQLRLDAALAAYRGKEGK